MFQRRVLNVLSCSICALSDAVYRYRSLAPGETVCARDSMAMLTKLVSLGRQNAVHCAM